LDEGKAHEQDENHDPGQQGNSGAQVTADPPQGGVNRPPTVVGRLGDLAGRPPIVVDGAPAPPMTSFVASKALSKSIDVTSAHDVTLVGDVSLKGRIILTAAVVDKVLKGSIAKEEMSKALEEK
jgi:hypothetical protein